MTGSEITVEDWTAEQLDRWAEQVLDVYSAAMDVPRDIAGGRRSAMTGHLQRDGLRAVAAVEQSVLVGTAYGHLGEAGQWWHDQVTTALGRHLGAAGADRWAGAFEVCELHVLPDHQGLGLGRVLLERLLGSREVPALLTTPTGPTRARGFYAAGGWQTLVPGMRFPGDPREFSVLGLPARG